MNQREKCDAWSPKSEVPSKGWPSWVTTGIALVAIVVVVVLVVGGVRACMKHRAKIDAQIHSMGERELWVFRGSGVFVDLESRDSATKDVVVVGATNADVETRVRVSSVDNIAVEYRADGKDFATTRLIGWMPDGTAEGAVILVPANDKGYYEEARREVHARHSSYENCPTCNPGKK